MRYIIRRFRLENGQRKKGLRKMRRRAVKSWKVRCPSIRRRRRCVRGALFLLAAGTHMVRIEESSPARAADRDGMTSVKRGFTIRLDERKIHIYQVEEGYKDCERSGDSGSD